MNVEYRLAPSQNDLSDRELMLRFESIGDSCEFGLVQRKAGAEPLGLLRFSGVPIRHLIRALENRFEGAAEPANIRLRIEHGEYMVYLTQYDFVYHAHVLEGEMDPEALHHREARRTRFLVSKLIADLEDPAKILVFRQNEPLLTHDFIMLRAALARYGASTLLWVTEAMPGREPGTVERAEDRLLVGYVRWLAPRENAHQIDHPSWLSVCRQACALWCPAAASVAQENASVTVSTEPTAPLRVEAIFGEDGTGPEGTGYGWSAPENGFTWAIDDRSLLTLDAPAPAACYTLEMEVTPFESPPVLPRQRLLVSINGEPVQTFDPLPRGQISCIVPGHLIARGEKVEILLEHPDAARPSELLNEDDTRRLAIAFRCLSLTGICRG